MIQKKLLTERKRRVDELKEEKDQLDEQLRSMRGTLSEMRRVVKVFKEESSQEKVVQSGEYQGVLAELRELDDRILSQKRAVDMMNLSLVTQSNISESKVREIESKFKCEIQELRNEVLLGGKVDVVDEGEEVEKEYFVEKRYEGRRVVGHVSGKSVKLVNGEGKDIGGAFPDIVLGLRDTCDMDRFVVEGVLVDGEVMVLVDCVYYDDRCLMDLQAYERKKVLLNNFKGVGGSVNIVEPIYVKSRGEMGDAVESVGGTGCMVRAYGSVYGEGCMEYVVGQSEEELKEDERLGGLISEANSQSKRPVSVDVGMLKDIARLTEEGCFRGEIGKKVGLSRKSVYNWQRKMGYYI